MKIIFLKDNFVHFFENLPKKVIVFLYFYVLQAPFGEKLIYFKNFRTLKKFLELNLLYGIQ